MDETTSNGSNEMPTGNIWYNWHFRCWGFRLSSSPWNGLLPGFHSIPDGPGCIGCHHGASHLLHSTKLGQLPRVQFSLGKIESSNEGRVHRIQLAELRLRSVVFFWRLFIQWNWATGWSNVAWLLGRIWCVYICSPLKICKKMAQTTAWGSKLSKQIFNYLDTMSLKSK